MAAAHTILRFITAALTCMLCVAATAQPKAMNPDNLATISLQHLTTADGLSYSGINDLCVDRSGNLWIATGNGLNEFNGKTVTKYYAADYPELASNNLAALTCDENNFIWVLTRQQNVLVIDANRKMHKVILRNGNTYSKTRALINTTANNSILFTENGFYQLNPFSSAKTGPLGEKQFTPFHIDGFDSLQSKTYRHIFLYDFMHPHQAAIPLPLRLIQKISIAGILSKN